MAAKCTLVNQLEAKTVVQDTLFLIGQIVVSRETHIHAHGLNITCAFMMQLMTNAPMVISTLVKTKNMEKYSGI
jgi:hypothetical protein